MGCGASSLATEPARPQAKASSPEEEEEAAARRRQQQKEAEEAAAQRRQQQKEEEEAAAQRRREEEAARRRQEELDKLITSVEAVFPTKVVSLEGLPDVLQDLHFGMPARLAGAPMRLLHIPSFLRWDTAIKVYEDVEPSECIDLPYAQVTNDQWAATVALSWRWGAPKPQEKDPAFSPMLAPQLSMLRETLERAVAQGFEYLWLDWSCVPQYSAPSMVEVLRSKVFYTRARAMVVLPTFSKVDGIVMVLLSRVLRMLERAKEGPPSAADAGAASAADGGAMTPKQAVTVVVKSMVKTGMVAEREYFSRIWTLVERMARFGRGERLSNWIPLPAWLGMLADAMLKSTDDPAASKIYKKILGPEASALLESILKPLVVAMQTSSMVAAEGLEEKVAELFVMGAAIWNSPAKLEETPSKAWLLSYLEEFSTGVYNCFSDADRIWALYSYFCWKQLDQDSGVALTTAVKDLVLVAGGGDKHLAAVAARLGLTDLQQEAEGRLQAAAEEAAARQRQAEEEEEAGRRYTTLLEAAKEGSVPAVRYHLARGADVNAKDRMGYTPAHWAARNGHTAALAALLAAGADVAAKDGSGWTPAHFAAANGHTAALAALLAAGADVGAKDSWDGNTPLHLAAYWGYVEAARALLAAGADARATNKAGKTPRDVAVERGKAEVAALLA